MPQGTILIDLSNEYFHELKSSFPELSISTEIKETVNNQDGIVLKLSEDNGLESSFYAEIDMNATYDNQDLQNAISIAKMKIPIDFEDRLLSITESFKDLLPKIEIISHLEYQKDHSGHEPTLSKNRRKTATVFIETDYFEPNATYGKRRNNSIVSCIEALKIISSESKNLIKNSPSLVTK